MIRSLTIPLLLFCALPGSHAKVIESDAETCENGGTYSDEEQKCICIDGYTGNACEHAIWESWGIWSGCDATICSTIGTVSRTRKCKQCGWDIRDKDIPESETETNKCITSICSAASYNFGWSVSPAAGASRPHGTQNNHKMLVFKNMKFPYNGKIVQWKYRLADENSDTYILVFRPFVKNFVGNVWYKYIGYNMIPWGHDKVGHLYNYTIHESEQISVQQNDVIGVLAIDNGTVNIESRLSDVMFLDVDVAIDPKSELVTTASLTLEDSDDITYMNFNDLYTYKDRLFDFTERIGSERYMSLSLQAVVQSSVDKIWCDGNLGEWSFPANSVKIVKESTSEKIVKESNSEKIVNESGEKIVKGCFWQNANGRLYHVHGQGEVVDTSAAGDNTVNNTSTTTTTEAVAGDNTEDSEHDGSSLIEDSEHDGSGLIEDSEHGGSGLIEDSEHDG